MLNVISILFVITIIYVMKNYGIGSGGQRSRTVRYTIPAGKVPMLFQNMLKKPHVLVAGTTGSGKSVVINGLISVMLHRFPADTANGAQMILIDPKRVELAAYKDLPHTITHAAGFNPDAWMKALKMATEIMDARYKQMECKRIKKYDGGDLFVIIDEWANVYKNGGKDAYKAVMRLTSEGRAAKVHVIMATQVPKAVIIPTEIRENFDARLCLRTTSDLESRVIMGTKGCEILPDPVEEGYAQGYYVHGGKTELHTIPYVKQEELDELVNHWNTKGTQRVIF